MLSGHTTSDALKILYEELTKAYDEKYKFFSSLSNFLNLMFRVDRCLLIQWYHVVLVALSSILFLLGFLIDGNSNYLTVSLIIFFLTLFSFSCSLFLFHSRHSNKFQKSKELIHLIQDCSTNQKWSSSLYLDLNLPSSQSLSLQWTVRDSRVINLPTCLLVEGDVILLRPGQLPPSPCTPLKDKEQLINCEKIKNELFHAPQDPPTSNFHYNRPSTLEPYIVLETPFLSSFKSYLEFESPPSNLENDRFKIYNMICEKKILPFFMLLMLVINIIRIILFNQPWASNYEIIIILQLDFLIPLLPLISPLLWPLMDLYGVSQLLSFHFKFIKSENYLMKSEPSNVTWGLMDSFLTGHKVHSFGGVTSVCCVDKKGILSWPNPSVEKIFFISPLSTSSSSPQEANFQILNLTQDAKNQYGLCFDDQSWEKNISSLKPLGLSILLNTCNQDTVNRYTEFADHVTYISYLQKEYIPVVNRRCFCQLSREMGFTENGRIIFNTLNMFGVIKSPTEKRENPDIHKYKMPYPNVFSVVTKDTSTGGNHLFSQGTGDLLLQLSSDFWDGSQVKPLSEYQKKKILDFYHRTSMTSYCTAFSYKPLNNQETRDASDNFILEFLSRDVVGTPNSDFYMNMKEFGSYDHMFSHFQEEREKKNKQKDFLNNQIFIALVTMQYQALEKVVTLIETLESKCIRFVHFSRENELRSRVFSEKMGLEAGWNCHISLLDDPQEEEQVVTMATKSSIPSRFPLPRSQFSFSAPHINKHLRKNSFISQTKTVDFFGIQEEKEKEDLAGETGDYLVSKRPSSVSSVSSSIIEDVTQNRAKLPRGIKNIRPHINNIDNVPLQVSLFTDCTSQTSLEMQKILQEFNEVICCLGSSLNMENFPLFLTANCSVSITPVHPQLCALHQSKEGVLGKTKSCFGSWDQNIKSSPMGLASSMLSLACTFSFNSQNLPLLCQVIDLANRQTRRLEKSGKLFLSMQFTLSLLHFLSTLFFLPPILSPIATIWASVVIVPILSLSIFFTCHSKNVVYTIHGQLKDKLFNQMFVRECLFFSFKTLPPLLFILTLFAVNLRFGCSLPPLNSTECQFFPQLKNQSNSLHNNWRESQGNHVDTCSFVLFQEFALLQLTLHFIGLSLSNYHPLDFIWKKLPFSLFFFFCIFITLISETIFFVVRSSCSSKSSIPIICWIAMTTGFFIFLFINELVKYKEKSIWVRNQKRAKLDFGTKLGMNSPF